MQKIPFSVLDAGTFVDHVVTRINDGPVGGRPAFSLVLGSGFSAPLIPTAAGMVKHDIAWWKYGLQQNAAVDFTNAPALVTDEFSAFAKTLWSSVHAATRGAVDFFLDPAGLPADGADNIAQAYQAVMSGRALKGLNTPEWRRRYFRAVCKRLDKQINLAHLYLGSLLHGQTQKAWAEKGRAPFTRTILTTNFDPLLQRALQLHNVLYFMTDQPEGGIAPPDDDEQAVHLVYTHGSVHRRHLANTSSEIEALSTTNAAALSSYFARQGVIVVGYSGWNDTTFRALEACASFEGNLYWCGRESGEQAAAGGLRTEVADFLAKNRDNRFYVSLGSDGANDLMHRLHKKLIGALPSIVIDPVGLVMDELDAIKCPEAATASLFDGLEEMAKNQLTLLGDFRNRNRVKPAAESSDGLFGDDEVSAARLHIQAMAAYHAGDLSEAIRCLTEIGDLARATSGQRARALLNRGVIKRQFTPPDTTGAIADYTAVLAIADAPAEQRAKALFNRGFAKGQLVPADASGEIADYSAVIAMAEAPTEQRAMALVNRGVAKGKLTTSDRVGAIADYDALIAMVDSPVEQRAMALVNRGVLKWKLNPPDTAGAIADYDAVITMADAPAEQRARALINRGVAKAKLISPDRVGAIADYDAVLAMIDLPAKNRAMALINRGTSKAQLIPPDTAGAIADYDTVLAMIDAPDEQRAHALFNLACVAALDRDVDTTLRKLRHWRQLIPNPTRDYLDGDTDFDAIRTAPAFVAFCEELPRVSIADLE